MKVILQSALDATELLQVQVFIVDVGICRSRLQVQVHCCGALYNGDDGDEESDVEPKRGSGAAGEAGNWPEYHLFNLNQINSIEIY